MKWVSWQMWGRKRPPKSLARLQRDGAYRLTGLHGHWPPFPDLLLFWIAACSPEELEMIVQYCATCKMIPSIIVMSMKSVLRAALIRSGIDDVVPCNVDATELSARADALMAKYALIQGNIDFGELRINLIQRKAWRADTEIQLMPREFDLLVCLAMAKGELLSRRDLLRDIWKQSFEPGTNSVEVHICRLRARLGRSFSDPLIQTIRGKGYRFRLEELNCERSNHDTQSIVLEQPLRAYVANEPAIVNDGLYGPIQSGTCDCKGSECYGSCRVFL